MSELREITNQDAELGSVRKYQGLPDADQPNPARESRAASFRNLRFLPADYDQILMYAKATSDSGSVILVAVNLDPFRPQECTVSVPPDVTVVAPSQRHRVTELLTNTSYEWSERNHVRFDHANKPALILRVKTRL